ncbi:MAG: hypothetical protein RBT46_03660, partial [Weeksellaceae bacterium]|nr:hypothetical protein [Weeksellaceae bacterium]
FGDLFLYVDSSELIIFGVLFFFRVIEQIFLTQKILKSSIKLEKKIIFLLLNYAFVFFTPIKPS